MVDVSLHVIFSIILDVILGIILGIISNATLHVNIGCYLGAPEQL